MKYILFFAIVVNMRKFQRNYYSGSLTGGPRELWEWQQQTAYKNHHISNKQGFLQKLRF